MPVSLIEAITTMQGVSSWSDSAITHIDQCLTDGRWMRNNVSNSETNPTFHFAIEGVATNGDKERLISEYNAAGWGDVTVRNSAETGERPGMVGVYLCQYKS